MRRENEQPLVHVEGGGAVHPTRLKQLPDAKRLSALPVLKEPLSRLRKRLAPQERTKKEIACDIGHYPGKKNCIVSSSSCDMHVSSSSYDMHVSSSSYDMHVSSSSYDMHVSSSSYDMHTALQARRIS